MLFRKTREAEVVGILKHFIDLVNDFKRKTTAEIVAAVAPSESQIAEIKQKLAVKLSKHVDVLVTVDPSVIAGFKIKVDGRIIDATVKRHLDSMKFKLLEAQV